MVFLQVLLIFIGFSVEASHLSCDASRESCEFYQCISQAQSCNKKDYYLSFGKKYCESFKKNQFSFSNEGQEFIKKLRQCLQLNIINDFQYLTCSNSKKFSEVHHFDCYLSSGFCELPLADKFNIFRIVLPALASDALMRRTSEKIMSSCRHPIN